jgi:hypothetical protein
VLFLLVVALAALVALRERRRDGQPSLLAGALDRALDSWWASVVVGVLWAVVIAWTWGSVNARPVFHDELSYVFQARLFAEGRWTAPSPPLADLWAQPHVLVAPVMASKYPPGHALLLALGERFGAPAAVVLLLAALRGAMVFVLARRLANGAIALATSVFMLHGDTLQWGASFFSETTTGALVLVCWYALLRWHETPRLRWIALVAITLGWCAITRPVTALAFALPIGVVVLQDVRRTRRWRDLGVAMGVGSAVVSLLFVWSARTTGDWRLWPATVYTRDYMPFDYPHFGVVHAAARRPLPADLAALVPSLLREEQQHTLVNAPAIALDRVGPAVETAWWSPVPEALLALLALAAVPVAAWLGVATVGTLFISYLAHPTWAAWTIYYMEATPVLVFLVACGLAQLLRHLAAHRLRDAFPTGAWRQIPRATTPLVVATVAAMVLLVWPESREKREASLENAYYQRRFRDALRPLPAPAVIFVRHADWHSPHFTLVSNGPDWPQAPVWVLPDHGDSTNLALLRAAPDRHAFVFDEQRSRIGPYRPTASR